MRAHFSARDIQNLQPTEVYDSFWHFAAERQAIFKRRLEGSTYPWTTDPILDEYKFTNVYRASDRVSQFLIKEVIYSRSYEAADLVFRILLFKIFNKIETWKLLEKNFGTITLDQFSLKDFCSVLESEIANGRRIFSGAYIMPSGSKSFRPQRKHLVQLTNLESMLNDDLPKKICESKSLKDLFKLLRSYPLMGDFLAYQYSIDLNYSELVDFSESDFVTPGPGARSGIRKCFSDLGPYSESDVIQMVMENQDDEFSARGLRFSRLGNRPLQLIDIQNIFCEIDKYSRVYFPEITGRLNRTRIKRRYQPSGQTISNWYPPKWEINK